MHIPKLFPLLTLTLLISIPVACTKKIITPLTPAQSPSPVPNVPTVTSTPTGSMTPAVTSTFTSTPTTPVSYTPTWTPTVASWTLSGATTLTTGVYTYNCVHITTGSVLTISGAVTMFAQCFTLDAGATITGMGMGYMSSNTCTMSQANLGGPGATWDQGNGSCGAMCGGAGHGGAGSGVQHTNTLGTCSASGGAAYDDKIHPKYMGSAGGWPGDGMSNCGALTTTYSAGGALFELVVFDPASNTLQPVTLNGIINMNGNLGYPAGINWEYGGGGAGGTIWIEASTLSGNGLLMANGGSGDGYSSGAGGGGIISLITNSTSFAGTTSVAGGTSGTYFGGNGTVTFTTAPSSGY